MKTIEPPAYPRGGVRDARSQSSPSSPKFIEFHFDMSFWNFQPCDLALKILPLDRSDSPPAFFRSIFIRR